MDLESNDFISTTALNHAVEKAGFETKFGKYYLTVEDLVQLGLKPAAKLRNGTYWHKEAVQELIDKLTGVSKEKSMIAGNKEKLNNLELDLQFCRVCIQDLQDLARLAMSNEDNAEMFLRVMLGYGEFALNWSKQK